MIEVDDQILELVLNKRFYGQLSTKIERTQIWTVWSKVDGLG